MGELLALFGDDGYPPCPRLMYYYPKIRATVPLASFPPYIIIIPFTTSYNLQFLHFILITPLMHPAPNQAMR